MGALGITGIIVFACGAFLGFLVTALAPIRPETWWLWPAVRVAWQAGGAVWAGWAIATAVGEYRAATIGGMAALGRPYQIGHSVR